MANSINW